ncbi:helix-turn-helix domain-containing protein [Arcobacter lanthieri]|uniref:helix-turn-helix domain-containing protein n=1 Tax=Aliarcobacter lanthieri TaxID=1355374 RepID=UPI001921ABA8|nr:helix-turn-helix domain-containing protein [Aliarcobacter lanthieri]MBL3519468.1 helix-turn-helix domain-containing protein [Aliarcobacter lanthieri]
MNEDLLTIEEIAVRLNLSIHQVNKLRKENGLPCIKIGRSIRFNLEKVNEFLREFGKENASK